MNYKLNEELIDSVCQAIEQGATIRTACKSSGIGKSTFYRWQKIGEKEKAGIYRDFWDSTSLALAKARVNIEISIMQAALGGYEIFEIKTTQGDGKDITTVTMRTAPPDGRLLLKILERRYPEDWGLKTKKVFSLGTDKTHINLFQQVQNN